MIEKTADERQDLQEKIKVIENEMADLACDMENVHTINQYRQIYKYMKKNPSDKNLKENITVNFIFIKLPLRKY